MKSITLVTFAALMTLVFVFGSRSSAQDVSQIKYPKLNPLEIPNVKKIELDNGLRLYLSQDKSLPIFRASVRINIGSYLEPADKIGLADITSSVLRTGGTKKWSGDEIDEMLEAVGASVETSMGLATGTARINVLSEYTFLGLEVLAEVLRYPVFEQDKIDLEIVQQRSAIARRNDEALPLAIREFRKVIYGPKSVYARQSEYATINAISRDDLVAFHKKYFTPDNIQIGIWGDFDEKKIVKKIKKLFGDWSRGTVEIPKLPKVDYKFVRQVNYVEKNDVTQTNILLGHIGGLVTDEDYADRIVMNNILGGGFGNRMFNTIRSKEGLAYGTSATYTANIAYPGFFYGYVGTKSETTAKAIKEVIKVIKSMQTDPPTEEEMDRAKNAYLNSFVFNFDTKGEVVTRMMSYDYHGLPEDFLQQTKEKVEQVTAEDVVAAAMKNLRPDALQVVVVGKGEEFDMPLEELALGPVQTIDITIPSGEEKTELAITPENLEKGKNVLTEAAEAHGGLANFKKVSSLHTKGTLTIITPQGEMAIPFEELKAFPDKTRQEISLMGRTMLIIRNGSSGWHTGPTGELVPFSEEEILEENIDAMRNTIQMFQQIDSPEIQFVFDGSGEVDGSPVDFVVMLDKSGNSICRLAFDSKTHKLAAKSFWGTTMVGEGNIEERYAEFTQVEGILIPFKTFRNLDGKKCDYTEISEFNLNANVSADQFEKPTE